MDNLSGWARVRIGLVILDFRQVPSEDIMYVMQYVAPKFPPFSSICDL